MSSAPCDPKMKEREKLRKEGRDREKKVWGEEAGRREREREET